MKKKLTMQQVMRNRCFRCKQTGCIDGHMRLSPGVYICMRCYGDERGWKRKTTTCEMIARGLYR